MYGQDEQKRYPDIQNEFFERAAGSLTSRGAMFRFLALGARLHALSLLLCVVVPCHVRWALPP